jgi:glycosyltransferase involved in cell wall biosynthesis
VVICTYNNAAMLDDTLAALGRQQPGERARWSCVVVDNNCTDDTARVVHDHRRSSDIPGLRMVREPEQGLTPARLRGVRSTTAPWIAFMDDDCVLRPDWIAQAIRFAENHPGVGAFGGKVMLDWGIPPPPYVRAFAYSFAEQDHGDFQKKVPFVAGAGMVVNRSALSACRWIDGPLLLDRVGSSLVSGGDVEMILRIGGQGYDVWYVPQCQLLHKIPRQRMSLRYLVRINRCLGVSQALADALVWSGSSRGWLAASTRKLLADTRALVSMARRKTSIEELLIQASFRLGQLIGLVRIVGMSPARRRVVMGLAKPRAQGPAPTATA